MQLEKLRVYQLAMDIGERIWEVVQKWDYFPKDTIGKQLVRAIDSVTANLSEGFGRYYYKESKQFGYYSRGSLYESKTWLIKAHNRKLVNNDDFETFIKEIDSIDRQLNNYIKSIGKHGKSISIIND